MCPNLIITQPINFLGFVCRFLVMVCTSVGSLFWGQSQSIFVFVLAIHLKSSLFVLQRFLFVVLNYVLLITSVPSKVIFGSNTLIKSFVCCLEYFSHITKCHPTAFSSSSAPATLD